MLGNPILVNSLVINSCILFRLCSYAPFIFTRKWGKVESKHTLHTAADSVLANGDSRLVGHHTPQRFSSTYLKWWSHMGFFPYKTNTVSPSKKYLEEWWAPTPLAPFIATLSDRFWPNADERHLAPPGRNMISQNPRWKNYWRSYPSNCYRILATETLLISIAKLRWFPWTGGFSTWPSPWLKGIPNKLDGETHQTTHAPNPSKSLVKFLKIQYTWVLQFRGAPFDPSFHT